MTRIALIDQDAPSRRALRQLLASCCPTVQICGEAPGVGSGFLLIRQTQPDGIFLDTSLSDGTAFDLLDRFPQPAFRVVFTATQESSALRAFRYHALDYLLKPIDPVHLCSAMDRLSPPDQRSSPRADGAARQPDRPGDKITLHSQEGMIFLPIREIIRLESDGSYTTIFLVSGECQVVSRPIRYFEDLLPQDAFFRLHQSHLIHLRFVQGILWAEGGYAVMEDGSRVPIARRRKHDFLSRVRHWISGKEE